MFPTNYDAILGLIDQIDPVKYGQTRNYINGAVTKLSPYISRGLISTRQVAQIVLSKGYPPQQIESFLKELAWRDYFQLVWKAKGDTIHTDLKQPQFPISNYSIPLSVVNASTSIAALDHSIVELYKTGYMHNHFRMYVASLCCNVAQSHWQIPARWMYYHLLDADWASNALSWQWVAGSFSTKKYYANQENINKYSLSNQIGTFLDRTYEQLNQLSIPKELEVLATDLTLTTVLPKTNKPEIDSTLPIYIYTFYNLDTNWDASLKANRILLLEPRFFHQYPVCDTTIDFIVALSKNIPQCQVIVGNFEEVFSANLHAQINYKEHPSNMHYKGKEHQRDWMFDGVDGYFPSFFNFWKKAAKHVNQLT